MEKPLFWHQGLFLQPHHFQLEDLHIQSLLTPFHRFLQPHFWGVAGLDIQQSALSNFSFSILKGEFLFPDMTHVVVPGNGVIEARTFDQAWVEGGKPFTVYVGLKKFNDSGENVTVLSDSGKTTDVTTRFAAKAAPEEVSDLHQGGPKAEVSRLEHVIRIFWETETDEVGDYILMPVAQLERSGEEVKLLEQFIPPSLTINSSEILIKAVKEIRDQLASRGRQLEAFKKQRGIQTSEFGSRDMVYLLALRSLNRYIPPLTHIVESNQIHPFWVYALLRQLIGELSSFSERVNVAGELADGTVLLSPYDHRSLWRCFFGAQSLITQLLDEITAGPEYIFQLVYDGAYYSSELPPVIFEGKNRFYLVIETEEDPKSVLQSLETAAKLGARKALPLLIARALPGVRLEHLPVPPQELPRRARSIYFQIDHHNEQWAQVEKGHNLSLYWDLAPDDLKTELMVVGRT
ncbi:Type VI secretion protein, VC_A0114 family [uncultured Desulfobacterium sp.]|uniref:Type VI secretion protein, VC_A0114 family n=1 Tax=uncultured Desulfobacterium sp. TaxID=201089 RepID=A0A445N1Y1_9BACT|nr:Type VI secretion protein, VC_A0114 family [uncultured Desulfobacterium sp.]